MKIEKYEFQPHGDDRGQLVALEEMKNFGLKLGAKSETFYGLCGLGDLILTTSST